MVEHPFASQVWRLHRHLVRTEGAIKHAEQPLPGKLTIHLAFQWTTVTEQETEIIALTVELLTAITSADWKSYQRLCAEDLTAFEPEAEQHLVEGLGFHRHYFEMADKSPYVDVNTTVSSPHVRHMGDVAVIAYVRLTQRVADGVSRTTATPETRVWQLQDGCWKHVHFHRS